MTPRPPTSLTAFGSSQSHCKSKERYPTANLSHSPPTLNLRYRPNLKTRTTRISSCSAPVKVTGEALHFQILSVSGGAASSGGAPSVGTSAVSSELIDSGIIEQARSLVRGEDRRRCEKSSVEMWVDMTDAGLNGELGGVERACKSGVIGGAIDGSI